MKPINKSLILAAIAMALVIFSSGLLQADDLKTRMLERLPAITDLKARNIVGENNQGYLEILPGQSEGRDLVAAENKDRQRVYEQIAARTGTTVEVVGQRRALQIAEKAAPGEWLQDRSGRWYQN
ncbi:YdbL family protein [Desulfatitalea alkaliphila]|uniref:YdbL family protein n=1 Tax=Desulfatitalea alkaliphila TaxID=2929485 RepID=A0AA41ULB6_9BACT|nr:YdbL family protein [Desulfatitalea alkaliphila]MCJ8502287.1 YdbL family protein [Desulfatitalea alkaliphila]